MSINLTRQQLAILGGLLLAGYLVSCCFGYIIGKGTAPAQAPLQAPAAPQGTIRAANTPTSAPTSAPTPTLGPLPTAIQLRTPTPVTVLEWESVYIGMPADDVLKIHPKSETTEDPLVLGNDSEGYVVRWSYPGAYLILAKREGEGTDSLGMSKCYRVIEIQLR